MMSINYTIGINGVNGIKSNVKLIQSASWNIESLSM
jgi:hypothetical protein